MPGPGGVGVRKAYCLAVDGGGTKCLAVLVSTHQGVLGFGRAGGCNPQSAGRRRAVESLAAAIAGACQSLPPGERLRSAAFGLAGLDSPQGVEAGRQLVLTALKRAGVAADAVMVENDGLIALRGAADGGRGMLVVSGTGSIVYAGDGRKYVRVGGWGHRVGDVGSAYHIARQALSAAYRSWDERGVTTMLSGCLCEAAGVADLYALQEWLYRPDASEDALAALASAVDRAAAGGDPEALAILEAAGAGLGEMAAAAAGRAGLRGGGAFPVFLVGGVLQHSASVRDALLAHLREKCPLAVPEVPRHQPIFGALLLALGGVGPVDAELRESLMRSEPLRA